MVSPRPPCRGVLISMMKLKLRVQRAGSGGEAEGCQRKGSDVARARLPVPSSCSLWSRQTEGLRGELCLHVS